MRKNKRKKGGAVSTSMETVKHDSLGRYLRRLRWTLRLEH
jgi:hypothetical protein